MVVTNNRLSCLFEQVGIPRGTIIAFINGRSINNPADIDAALLSAQSELIRILAIAPDVSKVNFLFFAWYVKTATLEVAVIHFFDRKIQTY